MIDLNTTIPKDLVEKVFEAVELAKKYGTEESGAFVNGILDRIRLAVDKGELEYDKGSDS